MLYCTVLYYTVMTVLAGVVFSWWPRSEEVLVPELDWEQEGGARVGNPFVWWAGQQYLMYYSGTRSTVLQEYHCTEHPASSVHLADSHIDEPVHLGLARAEHPAGPWTRVVEQPLEVDPGEDTVLY